MQPEEITETDIISTELRFISIEEYITKYRHDIIPGFTASIFRSLLISHTNVEFDVLCAIEAERAMRSANLQLGVEFVQELFNKALDEAHSIAEALELGYLDGMKILGVSDRPPNNPNVLFELEPPSYFLRDRGIISTETAEPTAAGPIPFGFHPPVNNPTHNPPYRIYHTDNSFDRKIEHDHGAFVYKHSWWDRGYSRATVDVIFNRTVFQFSPIPGYNHNAYAYVAAQTGGINHRTMDFGLMLHRNYHLRPFYYVNHMGGCCPRYPLPCDICRPNFVTRATIMRDGTQVTAQGLELNGTMRISFHVSSDLNGNPIQHMTITRLGIGGGGAVQFNESHRYAGIGFNHMPGAPNTPLAFIQAMSLVRSGGAATTLNSGASFGPVEFRSQLLESGTSVVGGNNVPGGGQYIWNRRTPFRNNAVRYIWIQNPDHVIYY